MNTTPFHDCQALRVAVAALGAIFAVSSIAATAPNQGLRAEIHYAPDTREVTVRTPFGDPTIGSLTGVHPDQFVVYENGRRQAPVSVSVEHPPIYLGILLEYGGRFHALNEILGQHVADTANELLKELTPDDTVALWRYAESVEPVVADSGSAESLRRTLGSLPPPSLSEVSFHDALIATLHKMQAISGHKTLVLVTTGIDTFSKVNFAQALAETRRAGVPIYVVNLGALVRSDLPPIVSAQPLYGRLNWNQAEAELAALAKASGGRMYSPELQFDLAPMFDELIASLRTQYVFRYRSAGAASDVHTRTVRVKLGDSRKVESSAADTGSDRKVSGGKLIAEGTFNPTEGSGNLAPTPSVGSAD